MAEKEEWTIEKVMTDYKMTRSEAIQALTLMGVSSKELSEEMNGISRMGCEEKGSVWWDVGE